MVKLERFELRWQRRSVQDADGLWVLYRGKATSCMFYGKTKKQAVRQSATYCREWGRLNGRGTSLWIKGKDGQVCEERTYPRSADPRRRWIW